MSVSLTAVSFANSIIFCLYPSIGILDPRPCTGVPGLLCAKTRFVSIAAIPHILFHMCRQIGFALRATTKRGGLPSGFAAGMACRRFDLKVGLQAIRLLFDIPAPSTFVKRRRAIPTFGSRQAPRHEPGFARHEYPRTKTIPVNPMFVQPAKQACSCAALGRIRVLAGGGTRRVEAET